MSLRNFFKISVYTLKMESHMPENLTLSDSIIAHCQQSLKQALAAERHPSWKLRCHELADADFVNLGLLRCLSMSIYTTKSGCVKIKQ